MDVVDGLVAEYVNLCCYHSDVYRTNATMCGSSRTQIDVASEQKRAHARARAQSAALARLLRSGGVSFPHRSERRHRERRHRERRQSGCIRSVAFSRCALRTIRKRREHDTTAQSDARPTAVPRPTPELHRTLVSVPL